MRPLVCLLHGFGANRTDMSEVVAALQGMLPECDYLALDAPFSCPIVPGGRQWFPLTFPLESNTSTALYAGALRAIPFLQDTIAQLCAMYNVPKKRVCLLGFSQGAAMATQLGLFTPPYGEDPYGAILSYSGVCIPQPAIHKLDPLPATPVCLVHGSMDEVVPVDACHSMTQYLRQRGLRPATHILPHVTHTLSREALHTGACFLRSTFLS
jgi:phospholipase/carboxylesterase